MPRPDPKQILAEATRLRDETFAQRNLMISGGRARNNVIVGRDQLRRGEDLIDIPTAYKKTATEYHTPLIEEEGRQVVALIAAEPQPHIIPPVPEQQPQTTKMETFLSAALQELEAKFGNASAKCALSQVHHNIGWIYAGMKRKPYPDQPAAPDEDAPIDALVDFDRRNRAYKMEEGIAAVFDWRFDPTQTIYHVGNAWNPRAVYNIKEVDEHEMMLTYGVRRNQDGSYTKPTEEPTTMPAGDDRYNADPARKVCVVEYWDRHWCMILVEEARPQWLGLRNSRTPYLLEEWHHNWGRVPYFPRPAFETESLKPEYEFEGPLDALYAEAPNHNRLRTIMSNISHLTGFAPLQMIQKESGDAILDDSGNHKTFLDFEPGKIFQPPPGAQVGAILMSPEGQLVAAEVLASEARMRQFSLSDISKGVSPGADTANSSLTNLRRLQRSSLDPMVDNASRQYREIFTFWLRLIRDHLKESVFVYEPESGDPIELAPADIVTTNVQVYVRPDTGTDALIEEKQAHDLFLQGSITEEEFHTRRGKEAPETFVLANAADRLRRQMEPVIQQQIMADLGMVNAIQMLIAANQETGSARNGVGAVMGQMEQLNGMGSGSAGMPRQEGVRSPAVQTTTSPGNGVGPYA